MAIKEFRVVLPGSKDVPVAAGTLGWQGLGTFLSMKNSIVY